MPLGSEGMVTKARSWLIAGAATAAMFVIILAVGNPSVTRSIVEHNADGHGFGSRALQSFTDYGWDVTKLGNDTGRFYLAGVLTDVAVLVLLFLLVAVLTAGRGSFLQIFFATWVSVIVATMIAGYLRPAVLDNRYLGTAGDSKAETVFFSSFSPGALPLFVSIVFGVVVALVAAIVGVTTRRHEPITGSDAPAAASPERQPWAAKTATGDDERTTQMPAVDQPGGASASPGSQHTVQLPPVEDEPR